LADGTSGLQFPMVIGQPLQVRNVLRNMWANERATMAVLYANQKGRRHATSADMFFLDCVPVSPSRFRSVFDWAISKIM
jgi:hypothetical protein